MTHTDPLVIHTRGLRKSFGPVQALKALDLAVPRHSIFGFLGPNGAGKTTTIKLLLGLIRPTAGQASVLGYDTVQDSLDIRARIGYLPQHPHFYAHMTARETLRFVARFFSAGTIEARVEEMLALVGLEDKADRPVGHFSGGERQRLGLAQAQINAPELLILDEPAAALDPIGRHNVLELMDQLRQRATIFYSTHILDDVQQVSDTVAILNQGELVAQGPIEHLLAGSDHVIFEIQTKGDDQVARDRLSGQAWVADVKTTARDGQTTWQVAVVDEQAAEAQLLPLLVNDEQLTVTAFYRKTYELEEIFMNVIQGEPRDRA